EEAQRLCDRVAVLSEGRVAALDTPAGLVSRAASSTVISFAPSRPLDERDLAALPAAASVQQQGGRLVINGTDETVNAVITLLARERITARNLRVSDATLDDAFLDLTAQEA
ncbi:MAG: ABC transporter ATP-binding protein, partial [Actinomadura sp.]